MLQRFSDLAAQLACGLVNRADEVRRPGGRLARGGKLVTRLRGDEAHGHDEAGSRGGDVAHNQRANAVPLRHLLRERRIEPRVDGLLHSLERGANRARRNDPQCIGLRQIRTHCFSDFAAEGRVRAALHAEVGDENPLVRLERALREERSRGTDAERAHDHERRDDRDERAERIRSRRARSGTSSCAAPPKRHRRHGAVRGRTRLAAGRERWCCRRGSSGDALHVSCPEHNG